MRDAPSKVLGQNPHPLEPFRAIDEGIGFQKSGPVPWAYGGVYGGVYGEAREGRADLVGRVMVASGNHAQPVWPRAAAAVAAPPRFAKTKNFVAMTETGGNWRGDWDAHASMLSVQAARTAQRTSSRFQRQHWTSIQQPEEEGDHAAWFTEGP